MFNTLSCQFVQKIQDQLKEGIGILEIPFFIEENCVRHCLTVTSEISCHFYFSTDSDHEIKHKKYHDSIQNYEGDDPLSPWLTYIGWIQQTYISGCTKKLIHVIEKCITKFQDEDRYRQDLRFLKLWIVYTDNVDRAENIFSFMHVNFIGTTHAIFYRAYATCLFSLKNFTKALDILQQGIRQNAKPVAQLKCELKSMEKKIEQFKKKLANSIEDSTEFKKELRDSRKILGNSSVVFSANPAVLQAAPRIDPDSHFGGPLNSNLDQDQNRGLTSLIQAQMESQLSTPHQLSAAPAYQILRDLHQTKGLGYSTAKKGTSVSNAESKNLSITQKDPNQTISLYVDPPSDGKCGPGMNTILHGVTKSNLDSDIPETKIEKIVSTSDLWEFSDVVEKQQILKKTVRSSSIHSFSIITTSFNQEEVVNGEKIQNSESSEGISNQTSAQLAQPQSPLTFQQPVWRKLVPQELQSKENTIQPQKWTDAGGLVTMAKSALQPPSLLNSAIPQNQSHDRGGLNRAGLHHNTLAGIYMDPEISPPSSLSFPVKSDQLGRQTGGTVRSIANTYPSSQLSMTRPMISSFTHQGFPNPSLSHDPNKMAKRSPAGFSSQGMAKKVKRSETSSFEIFHDE